MLDSFSTFHAILAVFVLINLVAASVNHIDDTDETYGYWEPLHYLLYGVGLQTWEYAPVFAIRTYSFVFPFSLVSQLVVRLGISKLSLFRLVKSLLGLVTAWSEANFVCAVKDRFGDEIGFTTIILIFLSPGIFFSSTAYLPSAMCMSLLMLSNAAFLREKRIMSILWGCVAVLCTGWPFVGILFAPLGVHMVISVYHNAIAKKEGNTFVSGLIGIVVLALHGVVIIAVIQGLVMGIDYYFYNKWTSPTLNILLYNAIGGSGDELYGIEPASYYIRNLFLNMSLAWPLALMAPVVLLVRGVLSGEARKAVASQETGMGAVLLTQVAIWLLVLFSRPHKEERFMYPIYPLLAFAAALSVSAALQVVGLLFGAPATSASSSVFKLLRRGSMLILFALSAALFSARVASNHTNYGGYMKLWETATTHIASRHPQLTTSSVDFSETRMLEVCTGSEWYQFPSHFFLPTSARLQYLRDGFTGILPQHFASESGTSAVPLQAFNDLNREEPARYLDLAQCDYLVVLIDRNKPEQETELRAQLLREEGKKDAMFRQVASAQVISPDYSLSSLHRAYYIPHQTPKSVRFQDYILYERNTKL